MRWAESDK